MTTKEIIAALERAAKANRESPIREGNILRLPSSGEVIMTGDLHGNEVNFQKLMRWADLDRHPQRHLIVHELLHCSNNNRPDECHSYRLAAAVAEMKVIYPAQIHILLGNHAMAQISRDEILKNGQPMVRALNTGITTAFSERAGLVMQALDEFILSLPIAAYAPNRIWMSHSLPSPRHIASFDDFIFEKILTVDDLKRDSSLRALTWDRFHDTESLEQLKTKWNADIFIVGHQPQEEGATLIHGCMIILASDHPHGRFLPFRLDRSYSPEELFKQIKPLAAIA
ncbi:MAG: metallophosphoesterase [Sedimentisphaerales bacterium]|nr:metallophosphoesterase [Sedimentisphaerales bacterium]